MMMLLRGELSTVTLRPAQARVHHGPSRAATSLSLAVASATVCTTASLSGVARIQSC